MYDSSVLHLKLNHAFLLFNISLINPLSYTCSFRRNKNESYNLFHLSNFHTLQAKILIMFNRKW